MKAVAIAIALLGVVSLSLASGLRAQIDASNKSIAAAMKAKDFTTLTKEIKAGTTPDFKYLENGKSESVDQMLEYMKMGLGMMKSMSVCDAKLVTLKETGKTAVGTIEHRMVGTITGTDKKTHKMSFTGISQNTFVNVGGKWKMSSMAWKSQKQTMDGKAVSGMGQ